jgi:hypothetical protein
MNDHEPEGEVWFIWGWANASNIPEREPRRPDPDRERMDSRKAKVDACIDRMELELMGIRP